MLTAFRDVLKSTARRLGIEPALHLIEARGAWADVVGHPLAEAAEPRAMRGGVLLVTAAHPHAAQEIRLREGEILRSLSLRMPRVDVREIRVVVRGRQPSGER